MKASLTYSNPQTLETAQQCSVLKANKPPADDVTNHRKASGQNVNEYHYSSNT